MGRPRLVNEIDAEFAGLAVTRSCPAHGTACKACSRKFGYKQTTRLLGRLC
jgi:hypothetical protein